MKINMKIKKTNISSLAIKSNKMWSWWEVSHLGTAEGRRMNHTLNLENESDVSTIVVKTKRKGWHYIDWKRVETKIKGLQEKIVIATLNNEIKEVYRIQRIILQSFEGRALAVRKVVTNKGGKTSGVDNIKRNGPEDYWKAIETLDTIIKNPEQYEAMPVRRVYIPKPNSKEMRPLGIPTMTDRALQAVYQLGVDPAVETKSDLNSFGFRKNRSTHDAITAIRSLLDKETHPRWILEIDIRKCFDRISHEFMLKHTPICHKDALNKWLKSGIMEEMNFFDTSEGTPQGSIISPILCNVALNGLEEMIKRNNPLIKGISQGVHCIRYADDMVITSRTPEIAVKNKQLVMKFLEDRGLQLNEEKTKITHIKEGFDFLGFNIRRIVTRRKYNNDTNQETTLIIKPNEKGVNKLKIIIKGIIKSKKPLVAIISELNPILRGWAKHKRISYHSQKTFIKIDHWIYTNMMRWARSQSTRTKISRILKKYLIETNTRKWNWGVSETMKLINLAEIPIIKYRPLKLDKNPYIIENLAYFNSRKEKMVDAKFKAAVFKHYKHLCPRCGESLHNGEQIELHHIVPSRSKVKYSIKNIQPLHRICHQQVTHRKENITVRKYTN